MRLFCSMLLFFILLSSSIYSQKVLSLENVNRFKRITFHEGDFIRFRMKEERNDYNGHIVTISDSMVVIAKNIRLPGENEEAVRTVRDYIPIHQIGLIYYAPRTYARMMRMGYYRSSLVTGGILIGTSSVNTLVTGETPKRGDFLLAAGILGSGLIARLAGKEVYRIGKRGWRLRTLDGIGKADPYRAKATP
ncbi:MAG: hypothetical protein AAFY71_24855 [Bacteroidota bacterium]